MPNEEIENIEVNKNQLKLQIYSLVLRLRSKFYIQFEEDIQCIAPLTWYIDYKDGDNPENYENYSAKTICVHELRYRVNFFGRSSI